MIWGAKVDTINVIDLMIMAFTIMWLHDNNDDNVVFDDDNDNDNDDDDDEMNDDIDNDDEVDGNDDEVDNNDINHLVLHLYNLE